MSRVATRSVAGLGAGLAILVLGSALAVRASPASGDPIRGEAVFLANCVACHGADGKGDGPAAPALNPPPANFTDQARMAKIPELTREQAVREGGASVGASPMMPAFGGTLTDDQIRDVLAYIRVTFTH